MAATRKTVLFIVEGSSDKSALEKIFKTIYRRNKAIEFRVTEGDITSDPTLQELMDTSDSLEDVYKEVNNRIHGIVQEFLKDKKLKKYDIYQVVQIFDMDGAYVPDDAVIQGETYRFLYSDTNISCTYPDRAKKRNELKRNILNHLLTKDDIDNIPYEMYFMSCNLDHALYNEPNLDKEMKQAYADKFYEKFIGHEHLFPEFLETEVSNGVPKSVPGSWAYIKEDLHSLERHTNLHIYFLKYPVPDGLF